MRPRCNGREDGYLSPGEFDLGLEADDGFIVGGEYIGCDGVFSLFVYCQ